MRAALLSLRYVLLTAADGIADCLGLEKRV
jgi:hypothetical protein